LDVRILRLIATVIEFCDPPQQGARGHPPAETIRVLATLRRFLREGTPWRSLTATAAQASGSTLRRWLTRWARMGLLAQVHAVLVGMLRGHPQGSRMSLACDDLEHVGVVPGSLLAPAP